MANVYFKEIDSIKKTDEINDAVKELIERLVAEEKIRILKDVPLKVHFGEEGNKTYIKPKNFQGVIDFLKKRDVTPRYIETNALLRGERARRDTHIKLARKHGFTDLGIIIADGEHGEAYKLVEINKKHFKKCKIGYEFSNFGQMIVLTHFKGHSLAGFGGAIEHLATGCAARGGKLDLHINPHPMLNPLKCRKCKACLKYCPVHAINLDFISRIDRTKCIGCATCIALCPYEAIKVNFITGRVSRKFFERMAEYAYAAQMDKSIIYVNYLFNITPESDNVGKEMKPVANDIGVFVSTDPVAIDQACLDLLKHKEMRDVFEGDEIFLYAEEIGLGSTEYKLIVEK